MRSLGRTLVQAIGNPLRSDDAVGPQLIDRISHLSLIRNSDESNYCFNQEVDFEWVYQLQIENAEQWRGFKNVIVVDADASATNAVTWREVTPQNSVADTSFSSHKQSPEFIYHLMRQFFDEDSTSISTRVFVLGIQAENFALGEHLSSRSAHALREAEKQLLHHLKFL